MRILSRYVLLRFFTWFAISFALLCVIAACADLLMEFERVQELRAQGVDPIVYLMMRLPAMHFRYLIPVASFSAVLITLGTASLGLEVVAAKAGGVSPHRLMLPVLAGAALLTGLTWVVNDTLVVRATHFVERPEDSDRPEIVFRAGSFWYHRGRTIYKIRRADPTLSKLFGVSVYERDGKDRLVRSIHARKVSVEGPDSWRLHDATIRTFDPARPDRPPGFAQKAEFLLTVAEDPDLGVFEADPKLLSTTDLRSYIAARKAEGDDTRVFDAVLQQRLAAPLTVLLFALLAIPAALQAERARTLATPALQGAGVLVVYWFVSGVASMISSRGLQGGEWAPWAVVSGFAIVGLLRVSRVPA